MTHQHDQSEQAVRATDLVVDSGGVRLAVRDYGGQGRPLIFIHGGPGPNLTSWDSFARRMAGQFRCIAYDQRGHGQSDHAQDYSYAALTGDIRAIGKALDLDAPVVVGHSWGGMIALIYAATYQDCPGVTAMDGLITGAYQPPTEEQWAQLEHELRTNPLAVRTLSFAGTPAQVEELLAWARIHHPEFSEEAFRRNLVLGVDGLLHSCHTVDSFLALNRAVEQQAMPGLEIYEQIRCPVLLVMAAHGRFHRQAVVRVQERFPHLRIAWLACGHVVQHERPDDLAALITDFVDSLDSS